MTIPVQKKYAIKNKTAAPMYRRRRSLPSFPAFTLTKKENARAWRPIF